SASGSWRRRSARWASPCTSSAFVAKPRPPLPGGPYAVVGLARSGVAAALALRDLGEVVLGIDAGSADDSALADAAQRLSGAGVEVRLNAAGDAIPALIEARTVIKSPGVPQSAPVVVAARRRGIPVLGELELAWRLLPNEFVAVTGTNGKTTTTEWIGHIHRTAGVAVAVAGNVGTAASSLVGQVDREAVVVCEASSFQLEDTALFAPEVALLLNLSPDHLDRHGSFENYRLAKMRVFDGQDEQGLAVMPEGFSLPVPDRGRARKGPGLLPARATRSPTMQGGVPGRRGRFSDLASARRHRCPAA